ncbi:putative nuclease HARBI1 [Lineus longissimus]|uniref:putative nuclease HARBI1 n=1 Tax=Lineus longissimus TaxID=88925 RepID=UPI00315D1192
MAAALIVLENLEARRALRRQRVFRDRLQPLDVYDDVDLYRRYRMTRPVLLEVIDLLQDDIAPYTLRSHAVPATLQVCVALRYFATGSLQLDNGDMSNGLSQPTISRIITRVATALQGKAKHFITFPRTAAEQERQKEGFYTERHRIPNVIGCVDGSLIPIKCPSVNENAYVCRKQWHAINVQGICTYDLKFSNIVARWPGATHDAFIWSNCNLKVKMERGLNDGGYLLGDSAYPLRPCLMTPVSRPADAADRQYNVHHRRVRNIIERTFGRWKNRWRCLHKEGGTLRLSPEKCCSVIIATSVLHNICENHGLPVPNDPPANVDNPDDDVNNRPILDVDVEERDVGERARLIDQHFRNM